MIYLCKLSVPCLTSILQWSQAALMSWEWSHALSKGGGGVGGLWRKSLPLSIFAAPPPSCGTSPCCHFSPASNLSFCTCHCGHLLMVFPSTCELLKLMLTECHLGLATGIWRLMKWSCPHTVLPGNQQLVNEHLLCAWSWNTFMNQTNSPVFKDLTFSFGDRQW